MHLFSVARYRSVAWAGSGRRVTESTPFAPDRITAIGEAKGALTPMDIPQLERLEHLRGLLPSARVGALPRLLLFARSGFTTRLAEIERMRDDVELIDIARLLVQEWHDSWRLRCAWAPGSVRTDP